jgi:hypothetical protein
MDGAGDRTQKSASNLTILKSKVAKSFKKIRMTSCQGCVSVFAHAYAKKKCVLSSSSRFGD